MHPSFLRALPPYLGNKRRLLALIFALLGDVLPRSRWASSRFLDPFCGSCAVALYARAQGFAVTASDVAEHAALTARALVANSSTRLTRQQIAALYRETEGSPLLEGVFAPEQAALLGRMVANAATFGEPTRSLLQLVIMNLALGAVPMSLLTASDAGHAACGDYDRISPHRLGHYLRARERFLPAAAWQMAERVNAGVIGGRGQADRVDAFQALCRFEGEVVYLDPPYAGTTGYGRSYGMLDRLFGGEPPDGPTPSLDDLLDAARQVPVVVLSYGGPTVDLPSLTHLVGRHLPVHRSLAVPYAHMQSVATEEKSARNREYVIVAAR